MNPLNTENRTTEPDPSQLTWVEDVHDFDFDELRELPTEMQLGIDFTIFD